MTVRLLREAMERARASNGQSKFLIDGFPRNPENLHVWNQVRFPPELRLWEGWCDVLAGVGLVDTAARVALPFPSCHRHHQQPKHHDTWPTNHRHRHQPQKMTGVARVKATLYLNAPEEVMLARLLERGECER